MRKSRFRSIDEDATIISQLIGEEQESWIPGKGVESFNFLGSQLWDTDWWITDNAWSDYFYLNRDEHTLVTVQRCRLESVDKRRKTYWNVYIERDITDWKSVNNNQTLCHTFRWVRSLKHALYLGEVAWELNLQVASPEDFYLTREEYDDFYSFKHMEDEKL